MSFTLTEKQQEYMLSNDHRINILSGSVRSGKTYVSLLKWALEVAAAPRDYEFLICGSTLQTLERNCLGLLTTLLGQINFRYQITRKRGELFKHRLWLEGAYDKRSESQIRGATLGGAYCDELTLLPYDFYSMLLSRMSLPNAKLFATTNPDSPDHWVKKEVLDNPKIDLASWKFQLEDNTTLDEVWVENLKREYSGVFYERYILGNWTVAEGLIYREFADNPSWFEIKEAPKFATVSMGVDFGGNHSATAFVAVGFTQGFRSVVVVAEERRPAATENPETLAAAFVTFTRKVKAMYPQLADVYCDSAEQVLIRGLRNAAMRAGIAVNVRNALKTAIADRIRIISGLIGAGRFAIYGGGTGVKNSLCAARWDTKKQGDFRLDNGSYDVDTLDALEYAIEPYARYLSYGG